MAIDSTPTDIKGNPRKLPTAITEVQVEKALSADIPLRGGAPGPNSARDVEDSASLTLDFGTGKVQASEPTEQEVATADAAVEPTEAADAAEPTEAADLPMGEPVAALADYDPANVELTAQYEKRYFNDKGKLNLAAVTAEFWGNAKDGKPGTLHEGTYKFIEDTLGVTKEAAQAIEAGLVARQAQENQQFWQRVGGKARYAAALEWGKANYTPVQRAAFNSAVQSAGGPSRDDAVDALLARYDRANPGQRGSGNSNGRRGPPQRRAAAPERSATAGAAVGAGPAANVPYASVDAYTADFSKAIAAERNAKTPAARREALAAREKVQADGRRSRAAWK